MEGVLRHWKRRCAKRSRNVNGKGKDDIHDQSLRFMAHNALQCYYFIHFAKRIIPARTRKCIKKLFAKLPLIQRRNEKCDLEIQLQQSEDGIGEAIALPPPPKHLQVRVAGGYFGDFIKSGYRTYDAIEEMLQTHAKGSLKDFKTILDFGCGCGRNIRSLKQRLSSCTLYGCDIDEEAIAWLKKNYESIGIFSANPKIPPTLYTDDMFDFIFGVSVFSHLPEDMQFLWLGELKRIIKQNGYLFLTTHGEKHYGFLKQSEIKIMQDKGFCFKNVGATDGLPEFYQASFHTHDYIRREWSRYFDVLAIKSRGIDDNQDTILLKKR
jgi:2-polyprenyl-3-methyl-5-hydroxy-6-metoxy-1,4-benzoquinol methylase